MITTGYEKPYESIIRKFVIYYLQVASSDCEMTPTGFDVNRLNVDKNRFRSINDVAADEDDIPMDQLSLDRSNDTTWFFLTDFLKGFRDPQVESA